MIRPAVTAALSSEGPLATQSSIIPRYSGTTSGSSVPAWESSRIRARTRSGAVRATRRAMNPPWDMPPMTAEPILRWSSRAMQSAARSQ